MLWKVLIYVILKTGPSVVVLESWYILFFLLRLHDRPWLMSRQQVCEPVLVWTFGWMHSLIQRRCCEASLSFSPSLSAQRQLSLLRCLPPANSMSVRKIWGAVVSRLDSRQIQICDGNVVRNAQQRKSGRSCRRIIQRGARTRWRTQMLHKQQGKLSGHLACNEKCTGDIDVKRGLYFRGNGRNGQSRKTENAALRHRVKSQWGARLQLHLCTVHLKSQTRMKTVATTHTLLYTFQAWRTQ